MRAGWLCKSHLKQLLEEHLGRWFVLSRHYAELQREEWTPTPLFEKEKIA